jgi:hypothetical protein
MKSIIHFGVACFAIFASFTNAAPREWTDQQTGRKITAEFVSSEGDQVTLVMNGKQFKLPITRLSPEDQAHIKASSTVPAVTQTAPLAGSGKVMGPIMAEGSSYYYYVPVSLKQGDKAPLLFFTGSGGGDEGAVRKMVEGAEICGWIVACSVELRNGLADDEYPKQTDRCLKDLFKTQPIDQERVYFTGNSGGARAAFMNAKHFSGAGVLALIAGAKSGEISKTQNNFIVSGATDFNRYDTASAYAESPKKSAYRMHPGAHSDGPDWLVTEGIVWLETMGVTKSRQTAPSRESFESAAIRWIEKMSAAEPYRAAWWARFFKTQGMGSKNLEKITSLDAELSKSPVNLAYIKGISDIEKFALEVLAAGNFASVFEHTTPEIQRKADKLLQAHAETPWIKEIAAELKKPTGKL